MRSLKRIVTEALLTLPLLGGCASIPDITVSYRPVKWTLLVTVVHTITCDRDGDVALVERSAAFIPVYSASSMDPRYQIRLNDLDRFFADADITVAFTDDGRLKSINQSTIGQGEAAIKTAVAAAASFTARSNAASLGLLPKKGVSLFKENVFDKRIENIETSEVCSVVREYSIVAADKLAQVSLVQTALVNSTSGSTVNPAPTKDQEALLEKLKEASLDLSAEVTLTFAKDELQPISELNDAVTRDEVALTLQRMVNLSAKAKDVQGTIGSKVIPIPTTNSFVVPIPKAALFGKQSFSLGLAESGRIASIGYGHTTGAPGALGTVAALASAETTEDNIEAAALKSAADLIAQQQRYNICKLNPSECK